jgi:signal peptidase II
VTHRPRWAVFLALAAAVVVVDQVTKAIVTAALRPGEAKPILDDVLRIVFSQNSGALFGLFKDNAAMFGVVSLGVIGLIVLYHGRAGGSIYMTITLGLLLGGAIGNMLDRLRLGYVVDFVDGGFGNVRWYTFNVADAAISLSIILLFAVALRPSLAEARARTEPASAADAPEPGEVERPPTEASRAAPGGDR